MDYQRRSRRAERRVVVARETRWVRCCYADVTLWTGLYIQVAARGLLMCVPVNAVMGVVLGPFLVTALTEPLPL
jgi:hypothetical protein